MGGSNLHVMRLALAALLLIALTACGGGDDSAQAGKEACQMYADEMAETPEAIASVTVLSQIKKVLADTDGPTRRALAGLITAASDFGDTDGKAAKVREVCLAEHGVDIPTY